MRYGTNDISHDQPKRTAGCRMSGMRRPSTSPIFHAQDPSDGLSRPGHAAARILTTRLCVGLALVLLGLAGCGIAPRETRPVVLYTSIPSSIVPHIEAAFEEAHPAFDLQVYRAGTGDVMARVEQELAEGHIGADLIWIADLTAAEELKQLGALLQYRPPEAAGLLPVLCDDEGYYFAGRLLNMVPVYNTDAVSTPPTGYHDLLAPGYRGRVGHATPDASGSFLYFVGALLHDESYGEDYFRQLATNEPSLQTNTETTKRVAVGELDVGITIDFTVRAYLRENPEAPIDLVYPDSGVVMVPSPVAIFKDASNAEGAKAFERYILSQSGQAMLVDLASVVPVRLDVTPPGDIQSITMLQVMPTDPIWIQDHREEVLSTFAHLYGQE